MFRFRSIDPSLLTAVFGGQALANETRRERLNTDVRQSRLGVYLLGGRIPVPYRTTTTRRTRTDFGRCVDESNQRCERTGGGNAAVGACMLNGIDLCARRE